MTSTELHTILRNALLTRRQELEGEVRGKLDESRLEHVGPDTGIDTDGGDSAALAAAGELQRAEARRDMEELAEIEAALKRLDEGAYGMCVNCGQPIGEQRLRAWPAAVRCIGCQTRAEAVQPR